MNYNATEIHVPLCVHCQKNEFFPHETFVVDPSHAEFCPVSPFIRKIPSITVELSKVHQDEFVEPHAV